MSLRRIAGSVAIACFALASVATLNAQESVRYAKGRYYARQVQGYVVTAEQATSELWHSGNPWVNLGGIWYEIGLDNYYRSAADCAYAAVLYDEVAQRLRYRTPRGRKAIAGLYAEYRLSQVRFNYSAALYLYYGMLEQGHDYGKIASPYKLNLDAMYLGMYDLE